MRLYLQGSRPPELRSIKLKVTRQDVVLTHKNLINQVSLFRALFYRFVAIFVAIRLPALKDLFAIIRQLKFIKDIG